MDDYATQDKFGGVKREDLKDSDFLFPSTRSYPIKTSKDVKDAIRNYGRGNHGLSFPAFIKKLYTFCKSRGLTSAIPDSSLEKAGINKKESRASELYSEFSAIQEKMTEIHAFVETCDISQVATPKDMSELSNSMDFLHKRMDHLSEALFRHMNEGHLPSITSAEQLTKAIKNLGLDGEFEIKKKVLYSSEDGQEKGLLFEFLQK